MSHSNKLPNEPEWAYLVRMDVENIRRIFPKNPDRWIIVDSNEQSLTLHFQSGETLVWPVSTAKAGLNGQLDSHGTPPGLHSIRKKIGDGLLPGTIFQSRKPTGEVWDPEEQSVESQNRSSTDDLILGRILTLAGMEKGLNHGHGCDSLERYIYIHGSNHETEIGRPVSHGCVRMTRKHIIELFDLVTEGDPVVII